MMRRASCAALRLALSGVVALLCMLAAPSLASAGHACSEVTLASIDEGPPMSLADVPEEWRIDDESGAGISLAAGASAVAPQPIQGPSDAHISAGKSCQDDVAGAHEISNVPDEAPLRSPSPVMAATLPIVAPLVAIEATAVAGPRRSQTAPHAGVRTGVFRPPRG